jgi:hypothetical protein
MLFTIFYFWEDYAVKRRARANGLPLASTRLGTGGVQAHLALGLGPQHTMSIRDFSPLYKWVSSPPPLIHEI